MSYQKNVWVDHVVDPVTGEVVQQGTKFTATRANNFEQGIADAHTLAETIANTFGGSYVTAMNGQVPGLVFSSTGLTANYTAGIAYVNGVQFNISAGSITLNPTQGQYIYVDADGGVKQTSSQAVAEAKCWLWYFATDASKVTISTDHRKMINRSTFAKKSELDATSAIVTDHEKRIDSLEAQTLNSPKQLATLKHGLRMVTTDRATPVDIVSVKGRTLVNLAGTKTHRTTGDVSTVLTPPANTLMDNAVEQNVKTPNTSEGYIIVTDVANRFIFRSSKYYMFMADIKLNYRKSGLGIVKLGGENGIGATPIDMSNYGGWQTVKHKVHIRDTDIHSGVIAGICYAGGVFAEAEFDIKNVRIYEIDKTTYDRIDNDPEYTGEKLAEKFPYVDAVQHLQNPTFVKYGKNLLPPFTEWTLHANAKVVEPYKLQLDATSVNQYSVVILPGLPNQPYTLNVPGSSSRVFFAECLNETGNWLTGTAGSQGQPITFMSHPETKQIKVYVHSTGAGTYTFTHPQLELGNVATSFVPKNDEYLYLRTALASNLDGTVHDTIFEREGKIFKLARFKEIILDGSINFNLQADKIGHKNITVLSNGTVEWGAVHGTKFDGSILDNITIGGFDIADNAYMTGGGLYLTVKDTDSGWGEGYNPSVAEIKAFFNGWVMHDERNVNLPYTSGNRRWRKLIFPPGDGQVGVDYNVATTPTTIVPGFTPYKLSYQLKEAVEEPIQVEGSLSFHEGPNAIELSEGVIARENTKPDIHVNLDNTISYYINFPPPTNSALENRVGKILGIFKNGVLDPKWIIDRSGSFTNGRERAFVPEANYDKTADYTVTYVILDKYRLTGPAIEASIQYATSDKSVLNEVVQQVSDNEMRLSVVETTYARKQQGQWIAPVMLNGWVNDNQYNTDIGYLKDEFGFVHLKGHIKNGSQTPFSPIFKLPIGYKTTKNVANILSSHNGTNEVIGKVLIHSNGEVQFVAGSNYLYILDGIMFHAEQ